MTTAPDTGADTGPDTGSGTAPEGTHAHEHGAHGGHRLMMLACCVPMLVVAGVLVATGVVGSGALVSALLCAAMMAAMMFLMPGHGHR
ncbi:hypothetical protein [Nocardioides sp.]|uniref:hypothetical protein n=1 Tax=Nocardioides sp. TaxID=35761 RepID=UPI002ED96956